MSSSEIKLSPLVEVFNCHDHRNNMSTKLQAFYEDKEFFDVVLIAGIDNGKINAHKLVLCASSDFFLAMFRSKLKEAHEDEIKLNNIDTLTLELIIEFVYTASVKISAETVERLLRAADFLQMNTLVAACCNFMEKQVDNTNCLGIALFAEQYNYLKLYDKSLKFVHKHFDKMCENQEFLQINKEQLIKIISDENAHDVITQESLLRNLMAWVKYDEKNRAIFQSNLLEHVDYKQLNPTFILENRHLICKSIEHYELICNWLQSHLKTEQIKTNELVFASFPGTGISLFIISFNLNTKTWKNQEWPIPISKGLRKNFLQASATTIGNKLYMAYEDTIECLNLRSMKWSVLPFKNGNSTTPKMIGSDEILYVIRFKLNTNETIIESIDTFNISSSHWESLINSSIRAYKITLLHNTLYSCDGSRIYKYRKELKRWETEVVCHLGNRTPFDIVGCGEYLYKFDINHHLTLALSRYNQQSNTWTTMRAVTHANQDDFKRVFAFKNRMLMKNGNTIMEYNQQEDQWETQCSVTNDIASKSLVFII